MTKIENKMRRSIAATLPHAMRIAVNSYKRFSEGEKRAWEALTNEEKEKTSRAKAFKEHHDACKVAIAHIKLLIELAQWADISMADMKEELHNSELAGLLVQVQQEMDKKAQ